MSATKLDRALHASVLKREAVKEREWRDKRRQEEEEAALVFGSTEMTKESLKKLVDSDRRLYYRTLELNDKLYIHYKGWKTLQNLDDWTGLKALYAECNAFDRIQGLQNCRSLRSLFLQENCIRRIEGLENLPDLWNINLSNNFIERIEGLKHLRKLNTLTIAKNKIGLQGLTDIAELADTTLASVDVQDNLIWDPDVVPEVFMRMTELRVLYLKGNPCTKKIPNYRKTLTVCCEDLRYLDDRPVFPEDRRAADAFNRGGLEEERAERRRIREENTAKHEKNMRAFQEMIANAKAEKRERDGMLAEDKFTEDTDPVETQEKRMKRQVDKWKEENAADLKDDAREHAERSLREERGQPEELPEHMAEDAAGEQEEVAKVDNRKLVYEDLWDDAPATQAQPQEAPRQAAAEPAAAPGVFMPWATGKGVVGMESIVPSKPALERAAASAKPRLEQRSDSRAEAEEGQKPTWYSKYTEKVQATQEALRLPGSVPMGPLARPAEAAPALAAPARCSELNEMD